MGRLAQSRGAVTAALQADHRIRRHALQRLADSEERQDDCRARSIARSGRSPRATTSSSTDRAAPTPACTRWRRSRTSTSARACRPTRCGERLNDELPADINILGRGRCRIASTRATTRSRAATSIKSRGAGPRSRRRSSGGSRSRSTSGRMREAARAFVGMRDFRSFAETDREEPGEPPPSTLVLVDRLDLVEDGDLVLVGIEGSHFLWKMVRRIVGVLVEIGRGGARAGRRRGAVSGRCVLRPARLTAPPSGLFLERVYYKGDRRDAPLGAATPATPTRQQFRRRARTARPARDAPPARSSPRRPPRDSPSGTNRRHASRPPRPRADVPRQPRGDGAKIRARPGVERAPDRGAIATAHRARQLAEQKQPAAVLIDGRPSARTSASRRSSPRPRRRSRPDGSTRARRRTAARRAAGRSSDERLEKKRIGHAVNGGAPEVPIQHRELRARNHHGMRPPQIGQRAKTRPGARHPTPRGAPPPGTRWGKGIRLPAGQGPARHGRPGAGPPRAHRGGAPQPEGGEASPQARRQTEKNSRPHQPNEGRAPNGTNRTEPNEGEGGAGAGANPRPRPRSRRRRARTARGWMPSSAAAGAPRTTTSNTAARRVPRAPAGRRRRARERSAPLARTCQPFSSRRKNASVFAQASAAAPSWTSGRFSLQNAWSASG